MKGKSYTPMKYTITGPISLGIALILAMIIINEFVQVIPTHTTRLQGILILSPLVIAPVGVVLGVIALRKGMDYAAVWGILLNAMLHLFPRLYFVCGYIIFGV